MQSNFIVKEIISKEIATLTLNRPETHNAFDDQIIKRLTHELLVLEEDQDTKIIILKSNGKNFSTGANLEWMKRMSKFSKEENLLDALQMANLFKVLKNTSKITIALAQGVVIGGGIGLLACCDIVIADEETRFCFSEAKLGLVPATIAPYVIQAIGARAAKYYFLTANFFSAQEAKELGLIQEIVNKDCLLDKGKTLAQTILKNGPHALTTIKKLVSDLVPFNEDYLEQTATLLANVRTSEEAQEGISAFFEKREPKWINKLHKTDHGQNNAE